MHFQQPQNKIRGKTDAEIFLPPRAHRAAFFVHNCCG